MARDEDGLAPQGPLSQPSPDSPSAPWGSASVSGDEAGYVSLAAPARQWSATGATERLRHFAQIGLLLEGVNEGKPGDGGEVIDIAGGQFMAAGPADAGDLSVGQ